MNIFLTGLFLNILTCLMLFLHWSLLSLYNFSQEYCIMKSKFTHEEKQAILDRYISKSESPTSIIKSVGISKSTFYKWLSDYKREQAEAKRKGLTLRSFNLLEAKVKRLSTAKPHHDLPHQSHSRRLSPTQVCGSAVSLLCGVSRRKNDTQSFLLARRLFALRSQSDLELIT